MKKKFAVALATCMLFSALAFTACNDDKQTKPKPYDPTVGPFSVWDKSVAESFGSGEGSAENPYTIGSAAELAYLAASVNGGTDYTDKYFKLTTNIDLASNPWTPIGGFDVDGTTRIDIHAFSGTIDGGGHTIRNLTCENTPNLFGLIGFAKNVTVKDLNFSSVNIDANSRNNPNVGKDFNRGASALIASSEGSVTIDNIKLYSGSLSGHSYVGGVLGYADATYRHTPDEEEVTEEVKISNVINYMDVNNDQNFCGSVLGGTGGKEMIKCTVTNCVNYGVVHGNTYTGGIVGLIRAQVDIVPAKDMTVSGCRNFGDVIGGKYTGGIVGWNRTMITDCRTYEGIKLGTDNKTLRDSCISGSGDSLEIMLIGYGDQIATLVGAITGDDNAGGRTDWTTCGLCDWNGDFTAEWEAFKLTDFYESML